MPEPGRRPPEPRAPSLPSLPPLCVATGPAVGGVQIAVFPHLEDGQVVWWEADPWRPELAGRGAAPARRAYEVHVVLSDRPFVFDDAEGEGPTALIPLDLETYRRLVQPRLQGPGFSDEAALEAWFLGMVRATA